MNQYQRLFLLICFLLIGCILPDSLQAQVITVPPDSLKLGANPVEDSARILSNSDRIIENLKNLSKQKTIMGRLTKALFRFDRNVTVTYQNPVLLNNAYEKHNYKVVRRIEIKTLNSFGYSINDTTRTPRNFIEKAGNSVHIKTNRRRIRNTLLFKRGSKLEPLDLSESERLLRQKEYILDARVLVKENTSTQDSVDILVITKDVFSLSGSGAYNAGRGNGRIGLNDINFLGQGHQFRNLYSFGLDSVIREGFNPGATRRTWMYSGSYTIENIHNTFITGRLIYRDEINTRQRGINFYRDFYTANTKYAGALNVNWFMTPIFAQDPEGKRRSYNLEFSRQDIWLGRSFRLKSYNLGYENPARLITAGRVVATDYLNSPNEDYQQNTLMVAGLGYSLRKYYRDQYLFGFGRTEDVPAGTLLALSAGYERGRLYDRKYVGTKMAFGKYAVNFGYLYVDLQFDSYLRGRNWEQGEFSTEILYFTKLMTIGTWQWRHFFWNRATYGINRKYGENLLNINRQEGIRGFRSPERGTRRMVFNYENSLYTPISFLGFRLALVSFADLAWLSDGNGSNPLRTTPYQGYGLGIRFRNEYMAFNTIQVLLGYYPQGSRPLRNFNSTRPYYDFNDFRFSQPLISDFR